MCLAKKGAGAGGGAYDRACTSARMLHTVMECHLEPKACSLETDPPGSCILICLPGLKQALETGTFFFFSSTMRTQTGR